MRTKALSILAILVALKSGVADETAQVDPSAASTAASLRIGDPAPALDIDHWFHQRDQQTTAEFAFEPGVVYVVEFWGTWCGPCIVEMPSLARLQQEYGLDRLRIVSVSDEPVEKIETFLAQPVPGSEGQDYRELTDAYSIATDPDRSVYKAYMEASGEFAVPKAFLVGKTGAIEWIGHPGMLQEPLKMVIAETWDNAKFAKEYATMQRLGAAVRRLSMFRQQHADQPDKVIEAIDREINEYAEAALTRSEAELIEVLRMMRTITLARMGRGKDVERALREPLSDADSSGVRAASAASLIVQMSNRPLAPELDIDLDGLAELALKRLQSGPVVDTDAYSSAMRQQAAMGHELLIAQLQHQLGRKKEAIATIKAARDRTDQIALQESANRLIKAWQNE